jgi:hypothetical protein
MERVRSSAAIKSDGNLAVLARGPSALLRQGSGHVTAGGAVPAVSYGGGAGVSNHPGLGRTSHVSSGASNAFHTASGVVGSSNTSAGGANLMGGWSMTGAMTPAAEAAFKEQEQLVSQVSERCDKSESKHRGVRKDEQTHMCKNLQNTHLKLLGGIRASSAQAAAVICTLHMSEIRTSSAM